MIKTTIKKAKNEGQKCLNRFNGLPFRWGDGRLLYYVQPAPSHHGSGQQKASGCCLALSALPML